jgi:hypothetical protein
MAARASASMTQAPETWIAPPCALIIAGGREADCVGLLSAAFKGRR